MPQVFIHIDNSKIMFGAAFVQYIVYLVFYLMFRSYNPPEGPHTRESPNFDEDERSRSLHNHSSEIVVISA